MSDSVILMVADDNYLPHAKAMLVSCVRQGNWKGDFCLLCPGDCDISSIEGRGIDVMVAPERKWTNKIKFRIFSPYFKKWKRLLYLDVDCLCQGDLNVACDELSPRLSRILTGHHEATVLDDWKHFDPEPDGHPEVYEKLRERFPCVDKQIRTADVMFFEPARIPDDATDRMFAAQEEFKEINPGEYDQQVMDLILYDQMEPCGKDFCTWWAFDDPGNRVPSEAREWRGDETPAILHYWGMYAPWLVKTPDAGAYFNHRLDRVCHELYAENLAVFDDIFPVRPEEKCCV